MVLFGWTRDNAVLRRVALAESEGFETAAEKSIALNKWVYENQGFGKNESYFLLKNLGPTPVQVLQSGGDCADKSRLLAALLAQIDIHSTLAMLYPCRGCPPVHTIVEVRDVGVTMAIDPVYNLYVPDESGRYLGIKDLAPDPASLSNRIRDLRSARGTDDKINFYTYTSAHFQNARTVNWNRNALTRVAANVIATSGRDPFLVSRPSFLEDPKLFISLALFLSAGVCVALYGAFVLWFETPDSK